MSENKTLSQEDEEQILESLCVGSLYGSERTRLQLFVDEYKKLKYYKARTVGLYATEFPDEITTPNNNVKVIGEVEVPYLFKLEY